MVLTFTHSDGSVNILGKNNALELDDEEVEKLLDIVDGSFEALARDGPVAARANLGSEALVHDELASDLSSGSDCVMLDQ